MSAIIPEAGGSAPVVVLRVGAEGGDVTLIGRLVPESGWQFVRVTEDQTEMLFGEGGEALLAESAWVEGWDAALQLMDRYPWAMLHPVTVHPEFREKVRAAVERRLARAGASRQAERVRGKWERVLGGREE